MIDYEKFFITKAKKLSYFQHVLLPLQKVFHLHTIITSCGHEKITDHSYSHNGLERGQKQFASFQYTLSGIGEISFENKVYPLTEGQTLLGIIPHNHRYYLPEHSKEWEFVYITFAGSEALRILKSIQEKWGPVFTLNSLEVCTKFEQILQHANNKDKNVFYNSSLAYSFLMALLSKIYPHKIESANFKVQKAIEYCKNNYKEQLTIEKIAQVLQISKFHLARLFHKETGVTIQRFLESYRLEIALQKIINTNLSIKAIALDCGFTTSSYFTQVFKKYYDYNPSLYQKQLKK